VTGVYLAPYGVGLGHASRLALVGQQLSENGVRVRFSSYGEAASYIQRHGFACNIVPSVEFAWSGEGGFSIKDSLSNIPSWFLNFAKQIGHESRNISAFAPNVVVSDSRLSPVFAARLLGVPSVVILNQIKLLLSPRLRSFALARFVEQTVGEFLGLMWDQADRILIPDLPPPYTIASHNLWSVGASFSRLEYVGYTSRRPVANSSHTISVLRSLSFDKSKPLVFFHVSGPRQTREPFVRIAIDAAKMLMPLQLVISGGFPDGSTEPQKLGENAWYYEWCPIRDELFELSDAIVMRGGHTALTQAIQFGKPVVTIPIKNHGEQIGNSAKIAEMGMGIALSAKKLVASELAAAVLEVLQNPSFKSKARDIMHVSQRYDGVGKIIKIISSYFK
jgi:UDP-N-acetylglucosamine--N-acetylmuramyl-(pentapeptide) pyrophosphoryl-undecaprenol N-acetylglucosamine transferase